MSTQKEIAAEVKSYTLDQLVLRIKNRDEAAISILYDKYAESLFGVINKLLPDIHLAEDALQNVFIKVWLRIDNYKASRGTFFTWMYNMARNEAIDVLRSKQHRQYNLNVPFENAESATVKASCKGLDSFIIQKSLLKLEPLEKTVIVLAYYRGFTCKEIAESLHIPIETVKTNLQRAYKKLRLSLATA